MGTGRNFLSENRAKPSGIVLLFCLAALLIFPSAEAGDTNHIFCGNCNLAPGSLSYPQDQLLRIRPIRLDILSPSLGVKFYRDGIVFLSHTGKEGEMLKNHVNFGGIDAYYANMTDSIIGDHLVFSVAETFKLPCEAMTFTNDYSVMYYTRRTDNKTPEKIYMAKYNPGRGGRGIWITDSKPLGFCSERSTYTHPALNATGEFMVFASNLKGSAGGLDLYVTRVEGTSWSQPQSLGNLINTGGNESFPFLDSQDNLFFSSDGHKGFGGYDIYMCRYNGKGWDNPVNLTQAINTSGDDLAFTINRKDGKTALYSVRQKTGKNPLNLFSVSLQDNLASGGIINLTDILASIADPDRKIEVKTESKPIATQPTVLKKRDLVAEANKETTTGQAKTTGQTAPPPATKPVETKTIQAQAQQARKEQADTPVARQEVKEISASSKDIVVYRVQFLSDARSKGNYEVTVAGKKYVAYEYQYNGLYRFCAGTFSTLAEARNLLSIFKQEGYADAFVVAFRNGARSLDPALFR